MRKAFFEQSVSFLVPLAALFVAVRRRPPVDIDSLPPTKLPSTVDPMRDVRLFVPPAETSDETVLENERFFRAWVEDGRSGAPALTEVDANPRNGTRGLTPYERWALQDYFHALDLDAASITFGGRPPIFEGLPINSRVYAMTDMDDGRVYFPHGPRDMCSLWWLSVMAHELYHAGQHRLGAQPIDMGSANMTWGYVDNPLEVQARWQQRAVLDGLAQRARAFFARYPGT